MIAQKSLISEFARINRLFFGAERQTKCLSDMLTWNLRVVPTSVLAFRAGRHPPWSAAFERVQWVLTREEKSTVFSAGNVYFVVGRPVVQFAISLDLAVDL